jgi:hypothetical protein
MKKKDKKGASASTPTTAIDSWDWANISTTEIQVRPGAYTIDAPLLFSSFFCQSLIFHFQESSLLHYNDTYGLPTRNCIRQLQRQKKTGGRTLR